MPGGTIRFAVDGLSAFFLMPVFLVSALGSIYGEGYWPEAEHPDNARKLRCFYGIATAGLLMVMVAGDAWSFLVGWELVGLAAFFLVTTEQDDAEALRAGWIYIIAAHIATLLLFAMFGLLREATGTWLLVRSSALGASPLLTPILVLALLGFGIKAGVMPFHVWLPGAHAAAPSHISALLSGVVLKMGIYGLVRTLSLLPAFPEWLGLALLALGVVSGVLGVVLALAQHDLKRLLAYHSVENIGIILIGLGVGVLGVVQNRPVWAALGFAGGLLHVWNHAAFKSLLFYSAGAVIRAAGTRDLDCARRASPPHALHRRDVPGRSRRDLRAAPVERLRQRVADLLSASFRSLTAARDGATFAASLGAPALAFIGALAVACFVKAFGAVFLGNPRSPVPRGPPRGCERFDEVVDGNPRGHVHCHRALAPRRRKREPRGGPRPPRRRRGAARGRPVGARRSRSPARRGARLGRRGGHPSLPAGHGHVHVGLRIRDADRPHAVQRVVVRPDARTALPPGSPGRRSPALPRAAVSGERAPDSRATCRIPCWTD